MNSRVAFGEYREVGKHLFRQSWRPMLLAFILMLNMTLPVKLAIGADSPNLVGKWKGSRDLVVSGRRIVNQRVSAPVELEITNVAQDGSTFKGTLTLYPYFPAGQTKVLNLDGQIENGVLKAKLGETSRLELSSHGNDLEGKIIGGEHDSNNINLKKTD